MKVALQFHGDRREICDMAADWARELRLVLVEERFFPTYRAQLAGEVRDGEGIFGSTRAVDRISLSSSPVDLEATSSLDYAHRNPDCLFIDLGAQSGDTLRESFLAAVTDDAVLGAAWRKLRDRARSSMSRGAWAENVMSGARSWMAGHYYTAGAKRLSDAGVVPKGGTDWIEYRFE